MSIYDITPIDLHPRVKVFDATKHLYYNEYKYSLKTMVVFSRAYVINNPEVHIDSSLRYILSSYGDRGLRNWPEFKNLTRAQVKDKTDQAKAQVELFNSLRKEWPSHKLMASYPNRLTVFSNDAEPLMFFIDTYPEHILEISEVINPLEAGTTRVVNSPFNYRIHLRGIRASLEMRDALRTFIDNAGDSIRASRSLRSWLIPQASSANAHWANYTHPSHHIDYSDEGIPVLLQMVAPGYFKKPKRIVR